jgi:hypothetical protein
VSQNKWQVVIRINLKCNSFLSDIRQMQQRNLKRMFKQLATLFLENKQLATQQHTDSYIKKESNRTKT